MKKIILKATLLCVVAVAACSLQPNQPFPSQPLIIGNKLFVPADQKLIVPAGGILFTHGTTMEGKK